jgi:hypothetical protein
MNIRCPNNPEHHTFAVSAHVAETWKVDRRGNFLEVLEPAVTVVHNPDSGDNYTCCTCGAQASVEP